MNKRFSVGFLVLFVIFTLTGCQLAREDGGIENSQDKLIGIYASFDHVDLFDFENYINDNLKFSGGELVVEGEDQKYQGRLYATRKDEVKTSSQGDKYTDTVFTFDEVEGVGMFSPTVTDPLDNVSTVISSGGGEGFTDVHVSINNGDNEEGIELEGTLYASFDTLSDAIFINPVYQSEDGRVYLVTGQGFESSDRDVEGSVWSQTETDKVTVNENGKSKEYSSTVKASISAMYPTEKVSILQMDKHSNILKKDEYKPEDVPEEFKPESATDYIIVESAKITAKKQTKIDRTIFTKDDEQMWFFRNKNNKFFIKTYTTILWDLGEEKS